MAGKGYKTALLTDSTSDVPPEIVERYNVYRVPQYIIWGEEVVNDLEDITIDEFYQRLETDPLHPTTSKTNPTDIQKALAQAKADGAEEVLGIFLTSALSGTYDTAMMVASDSEIPFEVMDSRSVSAGMLAQIVAAAEKREAGGTLKEMREEAHRIRKIYRLNLSLATLYYLYKGGRLSKTLMMIGNALKLKPALFINHETGTIEVGKKVRTRSRALKAMLDLTFEGLDLTKKLRFTVAHGKAIEEAQAFMKEIKSRCDPFELLLTTISPGVGVHAGPGVVGIGVYAEEW